MTTVYTERAVEEEGEEGEEEGQIWEDEERRQITSSRELMFRTTVLNTYEYRNPDHCKLR